MRNPTIQFRLSPYQVARGLQVMRKLDPYYTPASAASIVRHLFLDYCSKMSANSTDQIHPLIWAETQELIGPRSSQTPREPTLQDLISTPNQPAPSIEPETQSTKSVVEDFSPPGLDDLKDDNQQEEE